MPLRAQLDDTISLLVLLTVLDQSRSEVGPWTRLDYSRASVAEKEDRLKVIRKAKVAAAQELEAEHDGLGQATELGPQHILWRHHDPNITRRCRLRVWVAHAALLVCSVDGGGGAAAGGGLLQCRAVRDHGRWACGVCGAGSQCSVLRRVP